MDKAYIKLFSELSHTTEVIAEQVMNLDKQKTDTAGETAAKTMRNDYAQLYDKIRD